MPQNDQPSNIDKVAEGTFLSATREVHERIMQLPDSHKMSFALNWRIPHSIFNMCCRYWPDEERTTFQDVDWFAIHQSRNLGYWSNGLVAYPAR